MFSCEKCSYTTDRKLNFDRHCASDKHIFKVSPLAQQLQELEIKEIEQKTKSKMKEVETKADNIIKDLQEKQELKTQKEALKKQAKEELLKADEKAVSYSRLETAIPLATLIENVIDRRTLEDYHIIINGATTFQEIFLRDFREEYSKNKSIILNDTYMRADYGLSLGYYMNVGMCLCRIETEEQKKRQLKRLFSLIPLYHEYLKTYAEENDYNTKDFNLSLGMIAELEAVLLDEITYMIYV